MIWSVNSFVGTRTYRPRVVSRVFYLHQQRQIGSFPVPVWHRSRLPVVLKWSEMAFAEYRLARKSPSCTASSSRRFRLNCSNVAFLSLTLYYELNSILNANIVNETRSFQGRCADPEWTDWKIGTGLQSEKRIKSLMQKVNTCYRARLMIRFIFSWAGLTHKANIFTNHALRWLVALPALWKCQIPSSHVHAKFAGRQVSFAAKNSTGQLLTFILALRMIIWMGCPKLMLRRFVD